MIIFGYKKEPSKNLTLDKFSIWHFLTFGVFSVILQAAVYSHEEYAKMPQTVGQKIKEILICKMKNSII